jgi:hypothetical protein
MDVRNKNANKRACIVVNPPRGDRLKTVPIYGVQRGGTSMVAGVVAALGVDLAGEGANHEDPRFQRASLEELGGLVALRNAEREVWGFKAPQTTMKIDHLAPLLRNPHYLLVIRNPAAVADSVLSRRGGNGGAELQRALRFYDRMAELAAATSDPLMIVNYERAAAAPEAFIDAVAGFLEIEPSPETRADAVAMVTGDGGGYVRRPRRARPG